MIWPPVPSTIEAPYREQGRLHVADKSASHISLKDEPQAPPVSRGSLNEPLVDITTIQGIESLFDDGPKDPYGAGSLAHLTDIALYSDRVRYPVPYVGRRPQSAEDVVRPRLVEAFDELLPDLFQFVPFRADAIRPVSDSTAEGALESLARFVRANPNHSKALISLHSKASVRKEHSSRLPHEFVYAVEPVLGNPFMAEMANRLTCKKEMLLYTLDMVLRYPMYGTLAGPDEWYLSHRVRTAVSMPNLHTSRRRPPNVAVPFGDLVYRVASREEIPRLVERIAQLRHLLDETGIRGAPNGEVERSVIRDVAQRAGLPGRLRGYNKSIGIATGLLGFVGLAPILGPPAAAAAATVTIGGALWDGQMPESVTRRRWLRFAIKYDVEDRVSTEIV